MQTTVSQNYVVGVEGRLVDRAGAVVKSAVSNDANLVPGRLVLFDSTYPGDGRPPLVRLPVTTGEVTGIQVLGFAIDDITAEANAGTAPNFTSLAYPVGAVLPVMFSGDIWLICEQAVTAPRTQVFVRFAAGGAGQTIGRVRVDADTANAVALPGAFFESICGVEGIVKVSFNPRR